MQSRTKITFGWLSIVIGCLLIGIPLAVYMNAGINTLSIIIGILGLIIAINGARYIHRANNPKPTPKNKKRRKK